MKEILGTLDFKVDFRLSNQLEKYPLPVEIRHPNLKLAMTGLTSEKLKIKPGKYLVISKLPAGQELFGQIDVKANEQNTAILKLNETEEPPHKTEAIHHYLIADRQKVWSAFDSLVNYKGDFGADLSSDDSAPTAQLRVFSGNLLLGNADQIDPVWQSGESERGLREFRFFRSKSLKIIQLLQINTPPLNMVLPTMQENGCQVFVTSLIDGKYTIDAHLENSVADMMLRYSQKGFYRQTELLCKKIDAENLLNEKNDNALVAAVGAYALLRFNEIKMLDRLTQELHNRFKWLPDGLVIRAEYLARIGRHKDALNFLLEIENCGLPIFSDGLSMATDRLSAYVEINKRFDDPESLGKIKNLLLKLQKFASYTDFREPFTTFTGLNVNNPSIDSLTEIREDERAINLENLNGFSGV